MNPFREFWKKVAAGIMANVSGSDILNMKPVKGQVHYMGGYTPMKNRSEENQRVAKQREKAWLDAREMTYKEFVIHGVHIKAKDRKTAIKKYNAMKR